METQRRVQVKAPTFLIVGAPKAGTSTLHHLLGQHPDVYMSANKEPRFFDLHYDRGLDFYRSAFFAGWEGERAVGEATPTYLYLPFVPERIRRSVPEMKIVAVLRNPVDRAFSSWMMEWAQDRDTLGPDKAIRRAFEDLETTGSYAGASGLAEWKAYMDAYVNDRSMLTRTTYIGYGHYADQLHRYYEVFPEEQVKVVLTDDLAEDTQGTLRDIWTFLDVDPDAVSDLSVERRNVARSRRMRNVTKWLRRHPRVANLLPDAFETWLTTRQGVLPSMSDATRRSLVDHYRPHNARLGALIGRDVSHWNN